MEFEIQLTEEAFEHLRALNARQRATVTERIEVLLKHDPGIETRNRKRMRENSLAPWELRVRNLRAYYDFETEPDPIVSIIAIGIKEGNRVFIGGKEIEL